MKILLEIGDSKKCRGSRHEMKIIIMIIQLEKFEVVTEVSHKKTEGYSTFSGMKDVNLHKVLLKQDFLELSHPVLWELKNFISQLKIWNQLVEHNEQRHNQVQLFTVQIQKP